MTHTEAVSSSTKPTTGKSPVPRSVRIGRALATPQVGRGLLFVLVAIASISASLAAAPGALGVLGAALALLMMTIAVIDWRSFIIPDPLTLASLVLALVHAAAQEPAGEPDAMLRAVAIATMRGAVLALVFLIIRNAYARIRGRQGLGLGDVKLAGVAGAWLGWSMLPVAIDVAAFAALSAYLLRQFVFGRPLRATNRVPFGLFFAPAIWLCWLLETMFL
jgi:leader peptidase (prepilin peptidase) / N-methyltransferase